MVGHSGSIPATIKAVETVDRSLARVLKAAESAGTRLLVTADHGNAETDDRSRNGRSAHRSHHEPRSVRQHRLAAGAAAALGRSSLRCGADYIIHAWCRAAGGDDRRKSWSRLVKHLLSAVGACLRSPRPPERRSAACPSKVPIATSKRSGDDLLRRPLQRRQGSLGVAPHSGPIFGIRYEKHVGGPASLMVRWSHVNSERIAIDPDRREPLPSSG